jgi:hypothetical protein
LEGFIVSEINGAAPLGATAVFTEKRSAGDAIAWFIILVTGFAAWRGHANAPALGLVMAGVAAFALIAWVVWRLKPAATLTISPTTISLRRGERVVTEGHHVPGGWARFAKNRIVFLSLEGPDQKAVFGLTGFDHAAVHRAVAAAGWEISTAQYVAPKDGR